MNNSWSLSFITQSNTGGVLGMYVKEFEGEEYYTFHMYFKAYNDD